MLIRTIAGLLGLTLMIAFLIPPLLKLKSVALTIVALIGVSFAVVEFIEEVRRRR